VNLLLNCQLTAPPSEVGAFRQFTLYATLFKKYDCLIVAEPEEIDYYYVWLKNKGAYDYIKQFVYPNTEKGLTLKCSRITFDNLSVLRQYIG
jgi:hypothetical protein